MERIETLARRLTARLALANAPAECFDRRFLRSRVAETARELRWALERLERAL